MRRYSPLQQQLAAAGIVVQPEAAPSFEGCLTFSRKHERLDRATNTL
jgi:hypothetical protein